MRFFLTLVLFAVWIYLFCTSFSGGPGSAMLQDFTGSPGSSGTCNNSGCHNGGIGTTVIDEITLVDTATGQTITNTYTPGRVYKAILSGYNTSNTYQQFGFQCIATRSIDGKQGGAFIANNTQTHVISLASGTEVIEHNTPINAASDTFKANFLWRAPFMGTVHFYAIINAVNHTGSPGGDQPSSTFLKVLSDGTSGVFQETMNDSHHFRACLKINGEKSKGIRKIENA